MGKHSAYSEENKTERRKVKHDPLRIIGIIAGCVIGVVILFFATVAIYLTPDRLRRIINEAASKNLAADVSVGKVAYTLWSSFPNLRVSIDSIIVNSRTLDDVPKEIQTTLPANSKRLASVAKINGAVNIVNALRGTIDLKDIEIINPECNLIQVNDTITNYHIFPKPKGEIKVPHIMFNTVKVIGPVKVNWVDMVSEMTCRTEIDKAALEVIKDKTDNYIFSLGGRVDLQSPQVLTVNSIPVKLAGQMALGFSPFTMTMTDCNTDIADIKTISDISIIADGKKIVIGRLNLDFSCADLLRATNFFNFPAESNLTGISGLLPLFAKLTLNSPYEVPADIDSPSQLPPFTLSVDIPEGELAYPLEGENHLDIHDITLQSELNVDPHNTGRTALLIQVAKGEAEGAAFDASGKITELLSGDPFLDISVKCNADLEKATRKLLARNNLKITGQLEGGTMVTCRLSGLKDKQLKDVNFNGDFNVNSLKINDAISKLTANLQNLSVKLNGMVPTLSSSGLGDSKLNLAMTTKNGTVNMGGNSSTVAFGDMILNGQLGASGTMANPTLGGKINMSAATLDVLSQGMKLKSKGLDIDLTTSLRNIPWSATSNYSTASTSPNDSILTHRVAHTPVYLTTTIPPMLQTGLSLLNLNVDASVKDAILYADAYPARNELSDLSLTTNFDKLWINNGHISTRGAEADITGKIDGLRGFLMSTSPTLLKINLDAKFKDVDINKLAGNYYAGQALLTGTTAYYNLPPLGAYTAADSLCVLIPRNLCANVRLHSDRAEYMGWQFSPLSTNITLHDGVATLGDLCVGTGYGNVDVDWTYSTADLNDIFMKLNVKVNDFDFKNFFKTFPEITASAPAMENLSGKVSANIDGKVLMFPSMFINTPSMTANANVHTSDITFKREGKIKTITDLMLIKGDSVLTINNLNIHGSFHDNLLQLDPFNIDCGPYKVEVAGVNNLQGEMYYHLGLLSSPIHLPFGVNLVGNWRHPGIRFGGTGINDGREREISTNLADNVNVNIMRELKHGWLKFIEIAAKYDAQNNQQYVFNVD